MEVNIYVGDEGYEETDLVDLLRHIADQVEKGFTSGLTSDDTWQIIKE